MCMGCESKHFLFLQIALLAETVQTTANVLIDATSWQEMSECQETSWVHFDIRILVLMSYFKL